MNIETTIISEITVIRLSGDLDTNSSPTAQDAINELIDAGATQLLINLQGVGFVSSTGLRVMLSTAKRLGTLKGNLRISDLNETVNEVFEISGFITILNVFPTELEALAAS